MLKFFHSILGKIIIFLTFLLSLLSAWLFTNILDVFLPKEKLGEILLNFPTYILNFSKDHFDTFITIVITIFLVRTYDYRNEIKNFFKKPARLTQDQYNYRFTLKLFALKYPAELRNCIGAINKAQIDEIKRHGEQEYFHILFQAMHSAWSSNPPYTDIIEIECSRQTEGMNVEKLEDALKNFFGDYKQMQSRIANLNLLSKIKLEELEQVKTWLQADADCLKEIEKLKILGGPTALPNVSRNRMASNQSNWTDPVRVNF